MDLGGQLSRKSGKRKNNEKTHTHNQKQKGYIFRFGVSLFYNVYLAHSCYSNLGIMDTEKLIVWEYTKQKSKSHCKKQEFSINGQTECIVELYNLLLLISDWVYIPNSTTVP